MYVLHYVMGLAGPATWAMAAGKSDIMILLLNKLMEDGNILYKVVKQQYKHTVFVSSLLVIIPFLITELKCMYMSIITDKFNCTAYRKLLRCRINENLFQRFISNCSLMQPKILREKDSHVHLIK